PALAKLGSADAMESARTTGRRRTSPAKKIIHDRSVRDSSRPKRRSACTAGTRGIRIAAGQPKKATSGLERNSPTGPTLASTLTPKRSPHKASAISAPARKTARSNSAIPVISRFSVVLLTLRVDPHLCRLLEQLRLALEELRVHLPGREPRVLHHAGEKRN